MQEIPSLTKQTERGLAPGFENYSRKMTDPVFVLWMPTTMTINLENMLSSLLVSAVVALVAVLLLRLLHFRSNCHTADSKFQARIPQGSFGWPVVGESIEFAQSPENFAASHYKRYGTIFKSNLFLRKVILGTTPDFARFVCNNSHVFTMETPGNVRKIGPNSMVVKDGPAHMSVKKVLQKFLLPEALRSRVEIMERIVLKNLAMWEHSGTFLGRDVMRKITLEIAANLLFGIENISNTSEGLSFEENLDLLGQALFSLPLNFPGSALRKAFKAKEGLDSFVKGLLDERRGQKNTWTDMLGTLLAAREDPESPKDVKDLDDAAILDNLVGMWFGFYETTSTTLLWTLKFLAEYPEVSRRLQAEQEAILKGKDHPVNGPRLVWDDARKMVYSQKFFKELQRMISLGAIVPRTATKDVEYNGYLIPMGWAVFPMINFIHSDPDIYPDPTKFNPDRFNETPKSYTYLPFGAGPHMCPGMEVAKLMSFVLIHHLTTSYAFTSAGADQGVERRPFPSPTGGYPINICRRN